MKYLVNRETKEHRIASERAVEAMTNHPAFNEGWQLVEADDEGWIPWSGGECPVPAATECYVRFEEGNTEVDRCPEGWDWGRKFDEANIIAYRPILSETAEKEQTEEEWNGYIDADDDAASVFDRLKSAIAASESIPSIIAEIDALLPEGYSVQRCPKEEEPAEDMSDWRNWREGDFVKVIKEENGHGFGIGFVVRINATETGGIDSSEILCELDGKEWYLLADEVRFHSRPAKVAE